MGDRTSVYLTSAKLAAVGGILGQIPTCEEYLEYASKLDSQAREIYRYMNFDQIAEFQKGVDNGERYLNRLHFFTWTGGH